MRISISARYAFVACATVVILAGCSSGGSSPLGPSVPGASSSVLLRGSANVTPLAGDHILYTFQGGTDGANSYAGLLVENGESYGTTFGGGAGPSGNSGTVFKVSPSGAKSILYSFQAGSDGSGPQAGLIAGSGGVLYGDTDYGGSGTLCSFGCGTVFALTPSGSGYTEKVIYAFQGGSDGATPIGNLLIDKSGALYGTTVDGGGSTACTNAYDGIGCGTVFKLTPSGTGYTETVLYGFQAGSDGIGPRGTLIADAKGALYGTTEYGGGVTACTSGSGNAGCGTVFKLTPAGSGYTESVLYRFQGGTSDGSLPRSALVADKPRGSLYGATVRGGASNDGTVYKLTPSGSGYTEHVIYSFNGKSGADPYDENGLYLGNNLSCTTHLGRTCLYGTTAFGGTGNCHCGTVFKLTSTSGGSTETVLYSFTGSRRSDGADPRGSVVADPAGKLYGTTVGGGLRKGYGIVFKVSP
jgi:uncharacterized repeat protein (TIGR03803 family)